MATIGERQAKAEGTRAQILAAAARRFAEHGYSRTRLEDVGEDVGVVRSAVLYHFHDKRQLYRAVLDDLFGALLEQLQSALVASGTLSERIETAVSVFVDYMAQRPDAARIAMRESVHSDPEIVSEMRSHAAPYFSLLKMIFAEGERSGVLQPLRPDPLHFVSAVAGSTLFYIAALPTFVADLPYDPLSPEQLEAHKRDVLNITRRLLGIATSTSATSCDPVSVAPGEDG